MTSVAIAVPLRPRRKTAKAAAETISKALDGTDDDSGEEYMPEPVPPSSPKVRRHHNSNKRRASNACNAGKKSALSPETTEYLKNWMLSPDHIDHPYPTEEEKVQIMRHCGIEMKQLTNWFVNNRKRIWKPKLEELKRRRDGDEKAVPSTGEDKAARLPDAKRKKTGVLVSPKIAKSHATVKAVNKRKGKVLTLPPPLVSNPLEASCSPSVDGDSDRSVDQVPPPQEVSGAATVTPMVDPMIISNFDQDMIDAAPLLPMTSEASGSHTFDIMPHSCNLVDPLTNKLSRSAQPCALCSACRDWNAGEFCPWDLTGIIGDISDDTSATATELTDTTISADNKEVGSSESIVSAESQDNAAGGNSTTLAADDIYALSSDFVKDEGGISSFPSTASFPVPQDDQQDDLTDIDIDVTWD